MKLSIRIKALYGLLVTVILLGAVEVVLRGSLGPPPPSVQVHSRIGDLEQYLVPDRDHWVPYYQQKAAAKLQHKKPQISVLGGSSVHGGSVGLRAEQEFPALLNRRLCAETSNGQFI